MNRYNFFFFNLDLLCGIAADFVKVAASKAGINIAKDRIVAELLQLLPSVRGDNFIVVLSLNKKSGIAGKITHRKSSLFNEGILETDGRKIWIKDIKRLVKKSNYG